ncbi:MAG: hypothetical protein K2Q18_10245 [Bdellovibrionales bacterium]|nr:hypothetical protein [Bdellovibrionales bacterium]
MKRFLLVCALALSAPSLFACTDFTGDYRTELYTYYSISQNGCESMDVVDETGANHFAFDGVENLLAEYDIFLDDTINPYAHVQVFLKSKMEGKKWVYHERSATTYLKTGEVDTVTKWAEVAFNKETNLVTTLHNADGSIETYVDVRNR